MAQGAGACGPGGPVGGLACQDERGGLGWEAAGGSDLVRAAGDRDQQGVGHGARCGRDVGWRVGRVGGAVDEHDRDGAAHHSRHARVVRPERAQFLLPGRLGGHRRGEQGQPGLLGYLRGVHRGPGVAAADGDLLQLGGGRGGGRGRGGEPALGDDLGPLAAGEGVQVGGQQHRGVRRGEVVVDDGAEEAGHGDGDRLRPSAGAGDGDPGRVGAQAVDHGGQVGGRVVVPGAGRGGRAAAGQLVEGLLGVDRGELPERDVQQRAAVEHRAAHVRAVPLQVGQAHGHAVGAPVEVDLVVAECLADLVQVPGRGGGGVVARVAVDRGQAAADRRGAAPARCRVSPGQVCGQEYWVPRWATNTRSMLWFSCPNACTAHSAPPMAEPPHPAR